MIQGFWVFAYGSLMWMPGFEPAESVPALLRGFHRRMCIISTKYRGTPESPGLVMGLVRGGWCHGLALRVPASKAYKVQRYLFAREMGARVYAPRFCPVRLSDGRRVLAYVYVTNPVHHQLKPRLPFEIAAQMVRQGSGARGTSREYLENTLNELKAVRRSDPEMIRLMKLVDQGRDLEGKIASDLAKSDA